MSITTFRLALTAAALCAAASTASAKPRRVVIKDFDGPRQLADAGRASVMSILGDQYDVVSTKTWDQARNDAARHVHGPDQWYRAAKQSGVGAVIEGMVEDEGRRKILKVRVLQADNGKEFDTIQIRMDKTGLSTQAARELSASLDQVLYWIDTGHNETAPVYPPVTTKKFGTSKPSDDGDEQTVRPRGHASDDDDAADPAPRRRARRQVAEADDGDDARPARKAKPSDADRADAAKVDDGHDAAPAAVATATDASDPEVHNISVLFPQSPEDTERLNPKAFHVPQKTTRFMIDGGGYMASRSLKWDADLDANVTPFAGVQTKGFAVNAAIYPFPKQEIDGVMSGFGVTGSLHHSVVSSVEFDTDAASEEYVINQNGWELGLHYRAPVSNLVTLDGGAFYGSQTYEIVDASPDFEVPDTKYSYLGASAHVDLAITDRAQIGFGARYFTVLDTGDLSSVDWFGPASASGLGLDASFLIPLPSNLYVRGQLSYQRISLDLSGGGQITDDEGVISGTDTLITGNVNVGIAF